MNEVGFEEAAITVVIMDGGIEIRGVWEMGLDHRGGSRASS